MNTKVYVFVLLAAFALLWSDLVGQAKRDDLPRMPGAKLLMGHPGSNLVITSQSETWSIQKGGGENRH